MATFQHKPRGSVVGSGNYVFRHYGDEAPGYTISITGDTTTGWVKYNETNYYMGDSFAIVVGDSIRLYGNGEKQSFCLFFVDGRPVMGRTEGKNYMYYELIPNGDMSVEVSRDSFGCVYVYANHLS